MQKELLQYLAEENGLSVISDLRFVDRTVLRKEFHDLEETPRQNQWSRSQWEDARKYLHL